MDWHHNHTTSFAQTETQEHKNNTYLYEVHRHQNIIRDLSYLYTNIILHTNEFKIYRIDSQFLTGFYIYTMQGLVETDTLNH